MTTMEVPVSAVNMSPLQQVIHKTRYARWNEEAGRRETWDETVGRYVNWFDAYFADKHDFKLGSYKNLAFDSIRAMRTMPSMRCLMMAGPALSREHLMGFNCLAVAVSDVKVFSEIMYASMCGCGVGFSVERQFTNLLPMVPRKIVKCDDTIVVEDSREGWCTAFATLIDYLYAGKEPNWDVSKIRPAGARLYTTGGYASGPAPLVDLFRFTVAKFKEAVHRRLNSLECHDIICKIGEIVVVGGVRRSALISLSNPSDLRMQGAKSGNWYQVTPWRALANNSAVYTERPTVGNFMREWLALYDSKSGERGIFNRVAAWKKAEDIGRKTHWDRTLELGNPGIGEPEPIDFLCNPCAEINLRSRQTCNLSEVVVRADDNITTLTEKVRVASMLGTWQAALTDFKFVSSEWRDNCQEEALLGVSLTGIMDNPLLNGRQGWRAAADILTVLRRVARESNIEWANYLGINQAAAVTTVKPSGTVSLLVDAAPGIHARYAPHYLRRVTLENANPVCAFLKAQGVPHEVSEYSPTNTLFVFPVEAPKGAVLDSERTAINCLEHYLLAYKYWADHNVSITVNVAEHEWPKVGSWVWEHFDEVGGISFLPRNDMVYSQAPMEPVSKDVLAQYQNQMPAEIDWSLLSHFEQVDSTVPAQERACVAGACELV